jgi:hypothetical protein
MFGSGYENCPEFGVLGGVIFKLDIQEEKLLFFGSVSGCTCLILQKITNFQNIFLKIKLFYMHQYTMTSEIYS